MQKTAFRHFLMPLVETLEGFCRKL